MRLEIRLERPEDYRAVEELTREAFWNVYAPGCCEHYLVHILRADPAFLQELDFAAVADVVPIGSVMAAKGTILCDSGGRREVVTIGPLSVVPGYQRRGAGARLLEQVRRAARAQGYGALFLCGDPAYYRKQGFVPAARFGVRTEDNFYAEALHACELKTDVLRGARGRYCEAPVYAVDEAAAEAFDRQFPKKEKLRGTPSQQRFLEIAAQRQTANP